MKTLVINDRVDNYFNLITHFNCFHDTHFALISRNRAYKSVIVSSIVDKIERNLQAENIN